MRTSREEKLVEAMKDLERIKRILASHKAELQERFGVRKIGVFGSYARSENTPASDVDVIVDLDGAIGWEIVDLHDYLEQILELRVDLVTTRAAEQKRLLWESIVEDLVYV